MKKIYSHIDYARVGHFQSILEEEGIKTRVNNKNSASVMGEIPSVEVWPELWVVEETQYEQAKEILKKLSAPSDAKIETWTCPQCNEIIEYGFGECWNCGTEKKD